MKKNLFINTVLGLLIIFLIGLTPKTAKTQNPPLPPRKLQKNIPPPCNFRCMQHRMERYRPIEIFSGKIKIISFPIAILQTKQEKLYLNLGPVWYWKKNKYKLKSGENVKITGYRWDRYILPITIFTPKGKIRLRDRYGFPRWREIRGWERRGWGCPY